MASIGRKLWRNKMLVFSSIPVVLIALYFIYLPLFKVLLGVLIMLIVSILIIIFALYIKFRQPNIPWTEEDGLKYDNINYAEGIYNNYELYIPKTAKNQKHLALVIFIHGGAWRSGDKKNHRADCRILAKKGYITASMNYSLLSNNRNIGPNSPSIFKMVTEINQCISHIYDFTNKKGFIIDQMALGGTSAGGHLAMLFSYMKNYKIEIPVKFLLIKVGPTDFNILFKTDPEKLKKIKNGEIDEDLEDDKKQLDNLIFCCSGKKYENGSYDKEEIDNLISLSSPIRYINKDTIIPAILGYGEKDNLIIPEHYKKLVEKYKEFNCKYELIVFPNSGHALFNDKDQKKRYEDTVLDWCKEYFGY